jgi:hypothetical protein
VWALFQPYVFKFRHKFFSIAVVQQLEHNPEKCLPLFYLMAIAMLFKVQPFHHRNNSIETCKKTTKQRKEKNQDNTIILMVSKFVGKPLLLCMQSAGKQHTPTCFFFKIRL